VKNSLPYLGSDENSSNCAGSRHCQSYPVLPGANFTSILSSTAVDSEGHEALRITIVIKPGAASKIGGDAALDTLVQIQDRLRREGEERFPIVEYATPKELSESGDF
jgi:hypothetical protein